jgi:hypothetical protein
VRGGSERYIVVIGKVQRNLSIYERIILKYSLEKYVITVLIRVMWSEIGSIGGAF